MFISNNHTSFHLWGKKNLVKHRKVSKHYETVCLQNLLLLFKFVLTAKLAKSIHIYAIIFFIFLKKIILIQNFKLSEKIGKTIIKQGKF